MTDRRLPDVLARRGLRSATDNLPPGSAVAIDAREFVRLFRSELEERVLGLVSWPPSAQHRRGQRP